MNRPVRERSRDLIGFRLADLCSRESQPTYSAYRSQALPRESRSPMGGTEQARVREGSAGAALLLPISLSPESENHTQSSLGKGEDSEAQARATGSARQDTVAPEPRRRPCRVPTLFSRFLCWKVKSFVRGATGGGAPPGSGSENNSPRRRDEVHFAGAATPARQVQQGIKKSQAKERRWRCSPAESPDSRLDHRGAGEAEISQNVHQVVVSGRPTEHSKPRNAYGPARRAIARYHLRAVLLCIGLRQHTNLADAIRLADYARLLRPGSSLSRSPVRFSAVRFPWVRIPAASSRLPGTCGSGRR